MSRKFVFFIESMDVLTNYGGILQRKYKSNELSDQDLESINAGLSIAGIVDSIVDGANAAGRAYLHFWNPNPVYDQPGTCVGVRG
jgi:hypothetical protein